MKLSRWPWMKVSLGLVYLLSLIPYWPFKVDDSYISFVYAKNLVEGAGLTYNGLLVEGYSNFLWTLLLAPFLALGFDPLAAARLISIASGLGGLFAVYQLADKVTGAEEPMGSWLSVALVATMAPFLAWTVAGLETVFLAFLIALLIHNEWNLPPRFRWLSPALLLAAALTRPEAALLVPCWLGARAVRAPAGLRSALPQLAALALAYATFVAGRWIVYGYPLPNTAYLKLAPSLEPIGLALRWLADFLLLRPATAIVILIGLGASLRRGPLKRSPFLFLWFALASFIGFVLLAGRDWMPHHRFLTPVLPLLAPLVAAGFAATRPPRVRLALFGLVGFAILFESGMSLTLYRQVDTEMGEFVDGLAAGGRWLQANTPDQTLLAVVDAGALAYYSERPTLDMLGLNDVYIAHSPDKLEPGYILDQRPQIIQLHVAFDAGGEKGPPTDHPLNALLLAHPEFVRCYRPDPGRPDDPYFPYFYRRMCD